MFEAGKTYKTRDGEEALIYCVDAPGEYPVHGRVGGYSKSWTLEGMILGRGAKHENDLLPPAPERISRKVWVNVYNNTVLAHSSKEDAVACRWNDVLRIAVPCRVEEIEE